MPAPGGWALPAKSLAGMLVGYTMRRLVRLEDGLYLRTRKRYIYSVPDHADVLMTR